jgi:hypothetical protein
MSFQNLLKKVTRAADKPEIVSEMQAALDKSQMSELSTQSNLDALRNENAILKGLLKECVKHFEAATGTATPAAMTAAPIPATAKPTAPISNMQKIENEIRLSLEKSNLIRRK